MRQTGLCVSVFICLVLIDDATSQQPAQWNNTLATELAAGINESTPIGTKLGTLLATDPMAATVFYGTDSSIVTVQGLTGEVTLKAALDREKAASHSIIFFAYTSVQAPVTVTLNVLDENDNAPQFDGGPFTVTVNEAVTTSTIVYDAIIITDRDADENSEVTLSCAATSGNVQEVEACTTFGLSILRLGAGQYRGMVVLNRALSFDYRSQYTLLLQAQDKGVLPLSSNASVAITVVKSAPNISPPVFLNTPISFNVYENRRSDVPILDLQVQSSNPSNTLSLIIIMKSATEASSSFSIGNIEKKEGGLYTAPLYTRDWLDREKVASGFYVFTVQARETIQGVTDEQLAETSVTAYILDVNDNSPMISLSANTLSVPESLKRDNVVPNFSIVVTDTDAGDNAFFRVSLQGEGSNNFRLSPTVASQRADISLIVKENLDYENAAGRNMQLKVVAVETETAEQRSSEAMLTVNVQDTNDNSPQFLYNVYRAHVREDRNPGFLVKTITAMDADSGNFGKLTYSLDGEYKNMLTVNDQTGEVYTAVGLDFETLQTFSVGFVATDGGGNVGSTVLDIQVLDYNDQAPGFVVDEYRAFVDESSTVFQPNITVKAVDKESDEKVTYSIIRGNIGNAFRIDAKTGVLSLLRPITYEETTQGIVTLTVEASDNGIPPQKSTVPVVITVRDMNDHGPVFSETILRKIIIETALPGTPVIQLTATDGDSGPNGQINYIIISGSKDNFVVHPTSGLLTVAPSANLDIDLYGTFYDMIIHALDKGSPPRSAQARVFVTVEDANNKIPNFSEDLYTFTVIESVSKGTNVGNVFAIDPDKGSNVNYTIDPTSIAARDRTGQVVTSTNPVNYLNLFRLGSTSGIIYTDGTLDRDYVAEVSFTVRAQDLNAQVPPVQIGSAVVIITIRSTADGGLSFNPPWTSQNPVIEVFIAEEEPIGTLVTTIVAHDPETGKQIVDYKKLPESDPQNFFVVNQETGKIYLNKRMDFEDLVTAQSSFRIQASTPDGRRAITTVTVKTQDINDHEPKFQLTQYNFEASEGLKPGDQIGVVLASDKDSGEFKKLTYSLSGSGSDYFKINPELGYLEVKENRTLDRESVSEFYLLVRATDKGARYAEVPLNIKLLDENDNTPQFTSSEYNMHTMEYVRPLTSLGQVHSKDLDEGANGVITYNIIDGNDLGYFRIDSGTGIVRANVELQGKAREFPYTLTVEAKDGGSSPRKATTIVQVHVTRIESQDGRPQIKFPPEDGLQVDVPENVTVGTNVTQILASDSDLGPEGELRFGFVPNPALDKNHRWFSIDPDTGLITLKKGLDRETKQSYELLVYVKDKGSPPNQVTRTIVVKVTDINDNNPTFANTDGCPGLEIQRPHRASVKEEMPTGTYVTKVAACDADSPPNNKLYYYIVCGNKLSPNSEASAFSIDKLTGEITTSARLDHESVVQYDLCVYASNEDSPPVVVSPGARRKRAVIDTNSDSVLRVLISVSDVNDNGPNFLGQGSSGGTVVTGLTNTLTYGSEVIQMQAADPDGQSDFKYTIQAIQFIDSTQAKKAVSIAHFSIDKDTGMVTTGLGDYNDYIGGSFELKIRATDSEERSAESTLIIYVLSSNQRSKFVFNSTPQTVQKLYRPFLSELQAYFDSVTKLNVDSLRYAIDGEGKTLYNGTDICFSVVRNNQVLDQKDSQALLDKLRNDNSQVNQLFTRYGIIRVDACEPHVTTRWWSNWWWLWWFLIAMALFIILVTFIVICVICCCWPKDKKAWTYYPYEEKPYVVLDPVSTLPPNYGYEWQEQIVQMR